tara:strand:+ start:378 stop:635 length:258 start_codon:yes stop_codon:yes gene_type:complete
LDGDGKLSESEIKKMMKEIGYDIDDADSEFVDYIMDIGGDINDDGYLTLEEIESRKKEDGEKGNKKNKKDKESEMGDKKDEKEKK